MQTIKTIIKASTYISMGFLALTYIAPLVPRVAPVIGEAAVQLYRAQSITDLGTKTQVSQAILANAATSAKGEAIDVAIQQLNNMRQ